MSQTIVTAFFDIGRNSWNTVHSRSVEKYLQNAARMMTLDNNMIIFIEPKYYDFVCKHRQTKMSQTKIYQVELNDLPMMQHAQKFANIMNSEKYRSALADPTVPECTQPLYDVIMFSKTWFMKRAIELNPFKSTHWAWLDFGVHAHMLRDQHLHRNLFAHGISDQIKFLCRSLPQPTDLDLFKFYTSHTNRLAGTMFTASTENMLKLHEYMMEEVDTCIRENVIDCDQSLFAVVYLRHPELFELYVGDWGDLVVNYYKV